jgi:hypothetical protein
MGAVRVVIAGNFPIGCVPVYLAGANVTRLPGRPAGRPGRPCARTGTGT